MIAPKEEEETRKAAGRGGMEEKGKEVMLVPTRSSEERARERDGKEAEQDWTVRKRGNMRGGIEGTGGKEK